MLHLIRQAEGFDWDSANTGKIIDKHNVLSSEAEQVFFNDPLLLMDDIKHSQKEPRYHALGVTDDQRLLHVTFTFRAKGTLVRIVSARDMHRKEREVYEQIEKNP
ncbi:MAG: BrnT family toxin [Pseudomonadales bacterium]